MESQEGRRRENSKYEIEVIEINAKYKKYEAIPRVTEERMMDEHVSYHSVINSREAKKRLKARGDHCYLTRYSEKRRSYVLSVYKKRPQKVCLHFEISIENKGCRKVYKIKGLTKEFNKIEDLLKHYEGTRIDPALKSIGRCISEAEVMHKNCIFL